ncbi:MAG: DUF131 domain-containing protein [Candidatus Bathyarchaeia archaeon]
MPNTEIGCLLGTALILIGIIICILTVIWLTISRGKKTGVKAAGAIIIGPLPIIFGTDRESLKEILLLSLTLTVLLVAAAVLWYFFFR